MSKIHKSSHSEIIQKYIDGKNCKELGKEYNVSNEGIRYILKKYNIPRRLINNRVYQINENYFDYIDTSEKAYFLGLLYADGCNESNSRIQLSLIETDDYLIKAFQKELKHNGQITYRMGSIKKKNNLQQASIKIASVYLAKRLSELGCMPKKSHKLKFPTEKQVPSNLINHFIRGYFDGDGCITKSKDVFSINFTGTFDFCFAAKLYIEKILDIKLGFYKIREGFWLVKTSANDNIKKFLDWIYLDSKIHLNRKYDKYKEFLNTRFISSNQRSNRKVYKNQNIVQEAIS